MKTCRMDHVSYAAGPEGLEATVARIAEALGVERIKGGVHPRFGTHNALFPMRNRQFLEVVEALDHPAALSAPFGQLVRARSEQGGGWMSWAVSTYDIGRFERARHALGEHARTGRVALDAEHRELVAADARDAVDLARGRAQRRPPLGGDPPARGSP